MRMLSTSQVLWSILGRLTLPPFHHHPVPSQHQVGHTSSFDPLHLLCSLREATSASSAAAGAMSAAPSGSSAAPPTATAAGSPTGSQQSATSTSVQSTTPSALLRKPLKTDHGDEEAGSGSEDLAAVAPPPATEASPYMLPIELLINVFLYLDTAQVVRAAQVCTTWYAASKDSRIWRQLSFAPATRQRATDDITVLWHFGILGARCGNAVESVDFVSLSRAVPELAAGLKASTQSLRHIRWSAGPANLEALRAVVLLARCCPKLETLELRSHDTHDLREFSKKCPSWCKPLSFTFIADGFSSQQGSLDLLAITPMLFDHATTLELKRNTLRGDEPCVRWISVHILARVLKNPAIEKLTLHGLWKGSDRAEEPYVLSAPSLTSLDLRWSKGMPQSWIPILEAPQLRELAIDTHLLHALRLASTSLLSSLTLRIVDSERERSGLWDIGRVWNYQGKLKIMIESRFTEHMLKDLAVFVWPGLEEVEIELQDHLASELISLISAREAGARGASTDQYASVKLMTLELLNDARTSAEPTNFVGIAKSMLALARAQERNPDTTPICSAVRWKIRVPDRVKDGMSSRLNNIPMGVLEWLEQQPNVEVHGSPPSHYAGR